MGKILLLGGTEEARDLADALSAAGANFTVSLAGRTRADYNAPTREGGFGGEAGLAAYLASHGCTAVVDATHPFAATISPAAKRAAKAARVHYYRLERMPWRRQSADRWIDVPDLDAAARRLDPGTRVFLAVGAGGIAPFLDRRDVALVARTIEPPDLGERDDVMVVEGRGPFDVEDERALWDRYRFDTLVTKNSGGEATAAKLIVARERRTLVFMVRRPQGQPFPNARTVERMMIKLRRHI